MEADMRSSLGRRIIATLAAGSAAAALGVTFAGAASAAPRQVHDPIPIRPDMYFKGYVNNHPPGKAVIKVACALGATTGKPVGGQPVEVEPMPATSSVTDLGYTGSAGDKITASLIQPTAAAGVIVFTSFYVKEDIPTTITVPCSGTGTMTFAPSPTSKTAKTAKLSVTFKNIAG
jgi:hypothetical protein